MDKLIPFFTSFQGRIPREQFWLGFGAVIFGSFAAQLVPVIGPLLGLVFLWPQVAIHVKRLHDMGYSGWVLLIPMAISFICITGVALSGGLALLPTSPTQRPEDLPQPFSPGLETASWFLVIAIIVGLAVLAWIGATPGQKGENKWGPETKT